MPNNYSPLRYPGGKSRLAPYVAWIIHQNGLYGGAYVEPYAGGAGVALYLLLEQYVNRIYINDIEPLVYAFWDSVLNHTDDLIQLIRDTPITLETRLNQVRVFENPDQYTTLERGFAAFFLNRTNFSGILRAGVIGGNDQTGKYKIDARYRRDELIPRIERIALNRRRIHLYNLDAITLLNTITPTLPQKSLVYLDPPYYEKGQELYRNFYEPADHQAIAQALGTYNRYWMLSYDNVESINNLYQQYRNLQYALRYTAQVKYDGSEVIFFSKNLKVPEFKYPLNIAPPVGQQLMLQIR